MSITSQQVPVDDVKLQAFVGQAVNELGATLGAAPGPFDSPGVG
jgi:hypothetical protein